MGEELRPEPVEAGEGWRAFATVVGRPVIELDTDGPPIRLIYKPELDWMDIVKPQRFDELTKQGDL